MVLEAPVAELAAAHEMAAVQKETHLPLAVASSQVAAVAEMAVVVLAVPETAIVLAGHSLMAGLLAPLGFALAQHLQLFDSDEAALEMGLSDFATYLPRMKYSAALV